MPGSHCSIMKCARHRRFQDSASLGEWAIRNSNSWMTSSTWPESRSSFGDGSNGERRAGEGPAKDKDAMKTIRIAIRGRCTCVFRMNMDRRLRYRMDRQQVNAKRDLCLPLPNTVCEL